MVGVVINYRDAVHFIYLCTPEFFKALSYALIGNADISCRCDSCQSIQNIMLAGHEYREHATALTPFKQLKISSQPLFVKYLSAEIITLAKAECDSFLIYPLYRFEGVCIIAVYYQALACH